MCDLIDNLEDFFNSVVCERPLILCVSKMCSVSNFHQIYIDQKHYLALEKKCICKTDPNLFDFTSQWLRFNYYTKNVGVKLQWISHKMNIWLTGQLKK